jgi:aspartate/methionine/tyrosine aminotransferase
MTHKHSDYMHWAKTASKAPFNLATSGVGSFPLRELPFDFGTLEINGPNSYGYPPLKEAIARQYRRRPGLRGDGRRHFDGELPGHGDLLDAGDEVVIEHPAYGLLVDAAQYIGADIKRFARREENAYAVDPAEIGASSRLRRG